MPNSLVVTARQRAALVAACDALVPSLEGEEAAYWRASASSIGVAEKILEAMAAQPAEQQAEFRQLLGLLSSRLAGLALAGRLQRFSDMPPAVRERVMQSWSGSRLNLLRKAFGTLKKLSTFIHYGHTPDGLDHNPTWDALGYPGPLNEAPAQPPRLHMVSHDAAEQLTCDVLVVGSGAGGGVAAGVLAAGGQDVLVIDKGALLSGADFNQREAEMIGRTYDRMGAFSSVDGGITIFAGSTVGGGTTVNWAGSFHAPDYVLDEWADQHGMDFVRQASWKASEAAVTATGQVNAAHSMHNPQNAALVRGSKALGEQVEVIHRNVAGCGTEDGCRSCGYCGMGCRRGAKQGTLQTWLPEACQHGARILAEAEVLRLTHAQGRVTGAEVRLSGGRTVQVRAGRVVLAASSLHTPAILMRSGIQHAGIGKNLFFHPTVGLPAAYQEAMDPWFGPMMSAVNKAGVRQNGNYGYWIETPPLHAGLAGLALPWTSARQHKEDLLRLRTMGSFIVLTRDQYGGEIRVGKSGQSQVHYALHPEDRRHVLQGISAALRLHVAAGADEVLLPHNQRISWRKGEDVEKVVRKMEGLNWGPNRFMLFTAHQMGACAMGGSTSAPVRPDGELRALKGVYVADGSVFPTAVGVNPMQTILTMGHHVASGML